MKKYKPSDTITANGQTRSLNEFARELGCPVQTIISRLKRGASHEKAIEPVKAIGGQNKGVKANKDVLNPQEIDDLLRSSPKSETAIRDKAMLVVAYRSGLRCFELIALVKADLDFHRGTISVRHGKGDKSRIVAMDAQSWQIVSDWLETRSKWNVSDDSPIFCTKAGGKLADRQVRAMVARRAKRAGITKRVHAHGLRRTMASELDAEGVPLLDISKILGHKDTTTTNKYLEQINPASALNAMRSRNWGVDGPSSIQTMGSNVLPPPGFVERLKTEIGNRLKFFSDARKSETDFEAVVLLF